MRAKWMDGVTEVLSSEGFTSWLDDLDVARKVFKRARARHEELLTQVNLLEFRAELAHRNAIDTLEDATLLEDESAAIANEAAELENASFELVSQFEMQRDRTTKKWEGLGALDMMIEDAEEEKKPNYEIEKLKKRRTKTNEEYAREDRKKQQLWAEVNTTWERSIDRDLALREKKQKAKVVRKEAESLFERYDGEAKQAVALKKEAEGMAAEREEADRTLGELMEDAREKFQCILHADFLYWISREDNRYVFCTPLIDDNEHYSVPLEMGQIYRCHHSEGIDGLELVEPVDAEPQSAEKESAEKESAEKESAEKESAEKKSAGEDDKGDVKIA